MNKEKLEKRKKLREKIKERNKNLIRKPPKVKDFYALEDVIVDGIFNAKVEDRVLLKRDHRADKAYSLCIVNRISDDGVVELWDETMQQYFLFDILQPPVLKHLPVSTKKSEY